MTQDFLTSEIFLQAGDALLLCDLQGQLLAANPAACKLLRMSGERLQQLTLQQLEVGGASPSRLLVPGLYALNLLCGDELNLPVEVRVSRIERTGEPDCLLLVARNISERSSEAGRLLEQNNLFSNIINNIPHSIYWKDRDLVYAGGNFNFAADVGLDSPQQLVGTTAEELPRGSEDSLLFQQCDQEVMIKDFPLLDFEEQHQREDGSLATLLTSRVPLKGPDGKVSGVLGIYTDITARRLAEMTLEKSEGRYKALSQEFQTVLDGIPDSLMLLDRDLKIVWANSNTSALLGDDFDDIPGRFCHQLWEHSDDPCDDCVARQSFASGKTVDAIRKHADGRIWGIKVCPIKDASGKVVNVVHLASDITEKKKLRDEADRAGRLAALGELSAGVAHEINNPNGLLLLNLPLLEDVFNDALPILQERFDREGEYTLAGLPFSMLREDLPRLLSELREGATRIRQIVDDLKNFVRSDPGELEGPFAIGPSIEKVLRLAGNTLKKSTDNFHYELADDLSLLKGNAAQIEQVLLNLLLNACNSLPDRQCAIELRVQMAQGRESMLIEVADQGCGISEADLPHVTDPFFTTRRELGGTGLGLSIAARIVREHGGRLHFASEPGQGTTVALELPTQKDETDDRFAG
ncbi:PAS domain S-box-containing protein [Malonomonas rubra DSM 5091]|uniref:histidine kinase n=1 Tax=Malonomonas rubra DSM 5091 TaxID=1122189 RepID=A0A1M6ESU7_MALRU|nr:PAS domain-containing protein [Malonomonas rubra]SHI88561.1 PAS domain S-box-containing protein [Malonomonas rubra DSM 5091]